MPSVPAACPTAEHEPADPQVVPPERQPRTQRFVRLSQTRPETAVPHCASVRHTLLVAPTIFWMNAACEPTSVKTDSAPGMQSPTTPTTRPTKLPCASNAGPPLSLPHATSSVVSSAGRLRQ